MTKVTRSSRNLFGHALPPDCFFSRIEYNMSSRKKRATYARSLLYGKIEPSCLFGVPEEAYMENRDGNLEQHDKPELIALIKHMLLQQPEWQWLLTTPLPTATSRKASIDPQVYRQ